MDYCFTLGPPISEDDAMAVVKDLGLHALAFDEVNEEDEQLHWHEFDSVSFVIEGTGAFSDADGNVTEVSPGCRLDAPAGWLHRNLAGAPLRIVLGTSLPGEQWTAPIDKDPADRPAHLVT